MATDGVLLQNGHYLLMERHLSRQNTNGRAEPAPPDTP